MKPRFRFPLTYEQAYDVLLAAYKAEVIYRGREFIDDMYCKKAIGKFAQALTADKPKVGIMLCGLYGNGKTTLLHAFRSALKCLCDNGLYDKPKDFHLLSAKEIAADSKDYERFKAIRAYEMLAIDDMGREPEEVLDYGNTLLPVTDLLEYRYDRQLFTIITTNLKPKEIRERYKARIADRLNEMVNVIIFESGSFRTPNAK